MAATIAGPSCTGVAVRSTSRTAPARSATTPRTLVPPTSMPMAFTPASIAQQRPDPAEHVEIGVPDAHLHVTRLGQRLLDGLLDDVVDAGHVRPAHRARPADAADVGARPA